MAHVKRKIIVVMSGLKPGFLIRELVTEREILRIPSFKAFGHLWGLVFLTS